MSAAQDNPPIPLAGAAGAPTETAHPANDTNNSTGATDGSGASDKPTAAQPAQPVASPASRPPLDRLDTPDLPTPPQTRASPSFSFHEERRLLKSDEYWLSHKLPRLPPAALATSPTASMDALMQSTRSNASQHSPTSTKHDVHDDAQSDESDEDLGPHGTGAYHGLNSAPARGNSMLSPSGPEYGDLDPIDVQIHRNELNFDERLGLEEETEERALGMDDAYLPGGSDRHAQDELHDAAVDTGESPSTQPVAKAQPGKN